MPMVINLTINLLRYEKHLKLTVFVFAKFFTNMYNVKICKHAVIKYNGILLKKLGTGISEFF